jgi:hypothetical protein
LDVLNLVLDDPPLRYPLERRLGALFPFWAGREHGTMAFVAPRFKLGVR